MQAKLLRKTKTVIVNTADYMIRTLPAPLITPLGFAVNRQNPFEFLPLIAVYQLIPLCLEFAQKLRRYYCHNPPYRIIRRYAVRKLKVFAQKFLLNHSKIVNFLPITGVCQLCEKYYRYSLPTLMR